MLEITGFINDYFNKPGITQSVALKCVDKALCHQVLSKAGLCVPKQVVIHEANQLTQAVIHFGFPCIVKPNLGSGSRGVRYLSGPEDLDLLAEHIHTLNDFEVSLIERFIEGKELGIDAIIAHDDIIGLQVREKVLTDFPFRQEIRYFTPSSLSKMEINALKSALKKAALALEIDHSIIHADIIFNAGSFHVIDISPRPSGMLNTSHLYPNSNGFCLVDTYMKLLENQVHRYPVTQLKQTPTVLSFFSMEGRIEKLPSFLTNLGLNMFAISVSDKY